MHAQCETLEQAEDWYEATKINFWLSGLEDSSIFAVIYDGNKVSINAWLKKFLFSDHAVEDTHHDNLEFDHWHEERKRQCYSSIL